MKMIRYIWLAVGLTYSSASFSEPPPFHPQPALVIQDDSAPASDSTQLKINVSLDDSFNDNQVKVGNISVCSDTACYRPQIPNKIIKLFNTRGGKSEPLVDLLVPNMVVKSIHFETVTGAKTLVGAVTLNAPLNLQNSVQGGELLVLVRRKIEGRNIVYRPVFAVGNLYSNERQSVYYNPNYATVAKLNYDTTISIPPGATNGAQIFSIAVHDTGDDFPLVDIYPVIKFLSPASISTVDLNKSRMSRDAPGIQESASQPSAAAPSVKRSVPSTGTIRFGEKASPSSQNLPIQSPSVSALAATDSCVAFLNANVSAISSSLAATGAVYLKGCETAPPYVHIVVSNNADGRELLNLSYNRTGIGDYLSLQKMETWSPGSQVTINGFTWSGDSGVTSGSGLARGFVQNNSNVLGSNRVMGGTSGSYDTNKLAFLIQPMVPPRWKEGAVPPLWTTGVDGVNYPYSVVSSSTSILKNGICSGDSAVNRWSAFGTTSGNRMIFVSSTSDGATSAAELCPIFQALGANFAIRLDGSTAAGMTIDGIRRNPITGANAFVYGSSRHIAYSLKVGYRTGSPAGTPIINNRINTPKNPCVTNPSFCQ